MGGTKIIVIQLKEIIKTAIFALIGLLLIIALVYFFLPKDKNSDEALYIPGTYKAQVILHNSPVDVNVTVSANSIDQVWLSTLEEVQEVFYPLVQPTMEVLASEIVRTQSLDISMNNENSVTCKILLDAVKLAVQQADVSNQ